ncbi:F-box/LRR-repeat protein At4g14103-like [Chenopodium quinoa]|uniref:F-box/LRR-repeat protein At4g14103-like n=1 Tax=Chenopodium quinoa TaxID=63459 RepID=UPI000B774B62|nr:F-box/LRR-repeat protein At4g14103-like [Chenopodium quinoa]
MGNSPIDEGVDRISGLPDNILGHILSFLPTKNAVGTSVLSHRWKYLFTLITNFDFDERDLFSSRGGFRSQYSNGSGTFKILVNRTLMLCKATKINKFRVKCARDSDCSNVNSWIEFALLRGVSELSVSTHQFESSALPRQLFFCETLVVLKLSGRFEIKLHESHILPHLKFLQLKSSSVKFADNCSLNRLISGCPMLEDMVLKGSWEDFSTINISSPTLRSLTLNFREVFMDGKHRTNVVLDLPNLLHFKYVDYLAIHYSMNFNSLVDARIDISLDLENLLEVSEVFCDSMIELLHGVSSAEHLYLDGKCMEALSCGDQFKLPTFNRLICLIIDWIGYANWRRVLPEFLHSSPVLDCLVFPGGLLHRADDDDYDDKYFWGRLRKPPPCLSTHLKIIFIDKFHGEFDEELKIAKYLIRKGKVLTKLMLGLRMKSEKGCKEIQKLMKEG